MPARRSTERHPPIPSRSICSCSRPSRAALPMLSSRRWRSRRPWWQPTSAYTRVVRGWRPRHDCAGRRCGRPVCRHRGTHRQSRQAALAAQRVDSGTESLVRAACESTRRYLSSMMECQRERAQEMALVAATVRGAGSSPSPSGQRSSAATAHYRGRARHCRSCRVSQASICVAPFLPGARRMPRLGDDRVRHAVSGRAAGEQVRRPALSAGLVHLERDVLIAAGVHAQRAGHARHQLAGSAIREQPGSLRMHASAPAAGLGAARS